MLNIRIAIWLKVIKFWKFMINQYVTKSIRESKVVYFKFDVREGDQICVVTQKMFFGNNLVLNVYKNQSWDYKVNLFIDKLYVNFN